jgi:ComF family protein
VQAFFDVMSLALCQEKCRACREDLQVDLVGFLNGPKRWKEVNRTTLCDSCFFKLELEPSVLRIVNIEDMAPLIVAARLPYAGPLKKVLYHLKYDDDRLVVEDLSMFLSQALEDLSKMVRVKDCVLVPVPLHWKRMLKRGFNQAELLANRVAYRHDIRIDTRLLARTRPTATQHQLGKEERKLNVAGAFQAKRKYAEGAHVILVDDLLTSGATLSSCASTLMDIGALSVSAITLAYAQAGKGAKTEKIRNLETA